MTPHLQANTKRRFALRQLSLAFGSLTLGLYVQAQPALAQVATKLGFTQHVATTTSGAIIPAITVLVEDSRGHVVQDAPRTVTLSTGTGTLGGTVSAQTLGGSATFVNVTLTGSPASYSLTASSPGLQAALGPKFNLVLSTGRSVLHAELAQQADAFVDSAGINIHVDDPLYNTSWSRTYQALLDLGIRHTREGVISTHDQGFYSRYQQLGAAGIKGIFITSTKSTPAILDTFIPKVSLSFEGLETINEADYGLDTDWITHVKSNLQTFYPISHDYRGLMVGPSLVKKVSIPQLGSVSGTADAGNMHNYFGGRNPGTHGWGGRNAQGHAYGSLPYALDSDVETVPGRPVITTETGYSIDPTVPNFVTEDVETTYIPRLLLEQWNAGVKRTYLYQLITTDKYGLLTSDGVRKPVFYATSNLLSLLSDKGKSFRPGTINYALMGGDDTLHHALFQKRDGSYWLALWVEAQGYDPDKHVRLPVSAQALTLVTPASVTATSYQLQTNGTVTTAQLGSSTSHPITVTDRVMLLKLTTP